MSPRWERLVVRAMGSKQTVLTVLDREQVSGHFLRLLVDCGGLLAETDIHPTMWLRLWFEDAGRPHQRAFTLVDPDPETGRAWLEFALHDGVAADWARAAQPGQTIEASLLGSRYDWDADAPGTDEWASTLVAGDMASLPAVNSLLDRLGETPVTVLLESVHDDDPAVPVRLKDRHELVRCLPGGRRVEDELLRRAGRGDQRVWVALEAAKTRGVVKRLRSEAGLAKKQVSALGYWRADA
ncbi:siderophore-interacting protein [Arthrobacter sp. UM1]|uniref:siderophore-interacting protein n=1 Tax=Arthrobacter sp. UM1 TaxID=2766776 RepID=UPI001CF69FDF|nr:siderophore-interacting protein [Arthrobacter sp. UM1]MCB4208391.1 siderophore-interacting protein [Arthrobacter sp. UM1]